MSYCPTCRKPMKQMEATCPYCGEDFADAREDWLAIVLHRSSLRDLFWLTTVMCLFFALLPWLVSMRFYGTFPIAVGMVCGGCAILLGDTAPLWSRIFGFFGILGVLFYPFALAVLWTCWLFLILIF